MTATQCFMAPGTSTNVAPMTENGNNCPTSEQAQNRMPRGTLASFSGKGKSERKVRGQVCRSSNQSNQARWHTKKPHPRKRRPYLQHILRKGRNRGIPMKSDVVRLPLVLGMGFVLGMAVVGLVSAPAPAMALPSAAQDATPRAEQGPDGQRLPLFGKITAVHNSTLEVLDTNGDTVTVKTSPQTEFKKDRQPAKRTDFKVGDIIIVRGEENADHSWTAQAVAARSMNGPNGPNGRGGPGGGRFAQTGTLGKDYVAGEIKSIDAPKLSVLRSDNVTQTLELNEETSLRKGRDSITMADIQPGDHLFARGAVENGVFVPKTVVVIGPEQWKRMREMGAQAGGEGGRQRRQQAPPDAAPAPAAPASSDSPAPAPNPPAPNSPEPQH